MANPDEAVWVVPHQVHDSFVVKLRPGLAALAVEFVADAGGVDFHRGDADLAFGHGVEPVIHFRHAWIGTEQIALGEANLQRIALGVLGR